MRKDPSSAGPTQDDGPDLDRRRGWFRALAGAGAVGAWTSPAAIAQARLRYGGDSAYAPLESLDAQGRPQGFQIELLDQLAGVLGVPIDIELKPWADTEEAFRQGRVDMIAMIDTPARRQWALFAHGHAAPALALYHLAQGTEPQGLAALAGLRVAVLSSEAMRETLATALVGIPATFLRHADAEQALQTVRDGRADVALLPRAFGDAVLASGRAPDMRTGRQSLRLQSYALAVAPGQQALHARLQQALDELERKGQLEALRSKWLVSRSELAERHQFERGMDRQRAWTWGLASASGAALLAMGWLLRQRSQRIAAERQQRRSAEELLERAFTQNPEPMFIVERGSAKVQDANAAALQLMGWPASGGLVGRSLRELAQYIDAQALQALTLALDQDGSLCGSPLRVRRDDGSERHCLVTAAPLAIGDATQVFCVVRDITDQLAADSGLRSAYDGLVAELEQLRRDAEAARGAQEQAEGLLQEFTRGIAHDLRTPLNALQGFSGLLSDRLRAGHLHEALTYSEHIERAAQRMNTMIGALSRLAQVAHQPLQRQTVPMQQQAADTWTLLTAARPTPAVEFRLDDLPSAEADPDLAMQVWQNLLENAWKYSAKGPAPKVRVDSHRDGWRTWYRITDNGAGFDMTRAKQLFKPFQRLHAGSEFEGTGVGLSMVRRIMDHHGGEVRLRSAPGVGTVAEFSFDAAP
jgi:PAS domain S-box-containing protein